MGKGKQNYTQIIDREFLLEAATCKTKKEMGR